MAQESTEQTIKRFIEEILDEPGGEDPLSDRDVDSLALEQLIDLLEEEYQIFFEEQDVARENFRSVSALAELVERRRALSGRPYQP